MLSKEVFVVGFGMKDVCSWRFLCVLSMWIGKRRKMNTVWRHVVVTRWSQKKLIAASTNSCDNRCPCVFFSFLNVYKIKTFSCMCFLPSFLPSCLPFCNEQSVSSHMRPFIRRIKLLSPFLFIYIIIKIIIIEKIKNLREF